MAVDMGAQFSIHEFRGDSSAWAQVLYDVYKPQTSIALAPNHRGGRIRQWQFGAVEVSDYECGAMRFVREARHVGDTRIAHEHRRRRVHRRHREQTREHRRREGLVRVEGQRAREFSHRRRAGALFAREVLRGLVEVLEGDWNPGCTVILKFPTFEAARAFYDTPEYQKAKAAREGAAIMRMVVVEGV